MLNKDQYNQDEYNDYYKQETEGAEIKGYEEEGSGFLKKAILFLGLIALGVAGYFGFKIFNNKNNTITKDEIVIKEESPTNVEIEKDIHKTKTIEEKVIKTIETNKAKIDAVAINTEKTAIELKERAKAVEEKLEKTIQKEVATQVQEKLDDSKKMSTKDISKIVDLVMNKMDKENIDTTKVNRDNDLLNALENNDNDIENKTIKTDTESIVKKDIKEVTASNKLTLKNNDEELTELSEQIKKLLNLAGVNDEPRNKTTSTNSVSTVEEDITIEESNNKTINYEDSISQEIKVRTNEMRIIIVKPGDTLNKIAIRAYGDISGYQKIFNANPDISRADKIYVGQKLRIPK